jgi:hypothetical protein
METNERVTQLENEIKILKNEVQAVLLDLRDKYLESENPFNESASPPAQSPQQIIINQPPAGSDNKKAVEPKAAIPEEVHKNEQEPPTVVYKKESKPEIAHEEVTRARQVEGDLHHNKPLKTHDTSHDFNLVTIGGLASWADESVRKLGRQRTETILDVAETMGLLPPDLGRIITKLISIESDGHTEVMPVRDYLDSLLMLTTLLGKDNRTEEALLAMLPGEDSHR